MLHLSQRPLTGSDVDRALFVDRTDELEHLERAASLDFNVLVLGERGIGATSLLLQHLRRLEDLERTAFYINASRAETLDELQDMIRIGLSGRREPEVVDQDIQLEMRSLVTRGDPDPLFTLRHAVGAIANSREGANPPIILLDGLLRPELVHELFGSYRDEVWELSVRWVVAGDQARRNQYLEPPADAFFDTEIALGPLDVLTGHELVRARLADASGDDEAASARILGQLGQIVERAGGNPRRLLAGARDATIRSPEEVAAFGRVLAAAEALGTTELAVIELLKVFGPTSASEPEFLDALESTRSRATQVLRRLEKAGLVEAFDEKGGVGRPRKLYAVTTAKQEVRR